MKNNKLRLTFVALSILALFVGLVSTLGSIGRKEEESEIVIEDPIIEEKPALMPSVTEAVLEVVPTIAIEKVAEKEPTETIVPMPTIKTTPSPVIIATATPAPTPVETPVPTPISTPQITVPTISEDQLEIAMANYLFGRINQSRSANNKPLLLRNRQIDNVAKNWSQVQAEYKTSSHNINLGYDLIENGAQSFFYSENIGYGIVKDLNNRQEYFNILSVIHNGMMVEVPPYDGHRRTILSDEYGYVGIGVEIEGREFWVTEDFVK